jgi:hypothetical protein
MQKSFKGGIQLGTTAFDDHSKSLDKSAKMARDLLCEEFHSLRMVKTFSNEMKKRLVGDNCFGFSPDGGAWFDSHEKLVAVFECKKQGTVGNAYERWWDNAVTAHYLNKDVVYVTFCSGEGAKVGECLDKMRRKAQIMLGQNFVFEMSPEGFKTEEIIQTMRANLQRFEC